MINARSDWHGDDVKRVLIDAAWEGIVRAVVYYHTKLQEELNHPFPPPSRPGEPPHKRTGWLQANILYELDEANLKGSVGVGRNAEYGIWLELGVPPRLQARPFLLATLDKFWTEIQAQASATEKIGG